jgi:hypothetical protein
VLGLILDGSDESLSPVSSRNTADAKDRESDQEDESEQVQEEEGPIWWQQDFFTVRTYFQEGSVGHWGELGVGGAILVLTHH